MSNVLILKNHGGAECRICGLNFSPESEDDQKRHDHDHRQIIRGGWPLHIREFLKAFGWAVAHNDGGIERQKDLWDQETGKRAVIFAWWTRAISHGVPENDFEPFMAAHFAFVDAMVSHDEQQIEEARKAIKRWEKYAG